MMRLHDGLDDSTGKGKAAASRGRSAVLSAVFILGVCLGVVVSERLYIANQEADTPAAGLDRVRSRKMELAGAAVKQVAALDAGPSNPALRRGKPRNALETLLRRVAPSGEVMVVISNMNLIHEHSLELWLDVRPAPERLPAARAPRRRARLHAVKPRRPKSLLPRHAVCVPPEQHHKLAGGCH